jgi:hypothetical protein
VKGTTTETLLDLNCPLQSACLSGNGNIAAIGEDGSIISVEKGRKTTLGMTFASDDAPIAICLAFNDRPIVGTSKGKIYDSESKLLASGPGKVVCIVEADNGIVVAWDSGHFMLRPQQGQPRMCSVASHVTKVLKVAGAFLVLTAQGTVQLVQIDEAGTLTVHSLSTPFGRPKNLLAADSDRLWIQSYAGDWAVFRLELETPNGDATLDCLLGRLESLSSDDALAKLTRNLDVRIAKLQVGLAMKSDHIRCLVEVSRRGHDLAFKIKWNTVDTGASLTKIALIVRFTVGEGRQESISRILLDRDECELTPSLFSNASPQQRMLPITVEVTSYIAFDNDRALSKICIIQTFDAMDTGALENIVTDNGAAPSEVVKVLNCLRTCWPLKTKSEPTAAGTLRSLIPVHWQVAEHSPVKASASVSLVRIVMAFEGARVDLSLTASDALTATVVHAALLSRLQDQLVNAPALRLTLSAKRAVAALYRAVEAIKNSIDDPFERSRAAHQALRSSVSTWETMRKTAKNSS